MRRAVIDAGEAKRIDSQSIEMGMPSLVLMERAALGVAKVAKDRLKALEENGHDISQLKTVCVCGYGNNGADGVATARILTGYGYSCDILLVGNEEHATNEMKTQLELAKQINVSIRTFDSIKHNTFNEEYFAAYNIIIDGIFGIGLTRTVEGDYERVINLINDAGEDSYVVSIDIPSGVSAGSGKILGTAVKADCTVTFGEYKLGHILYPGRECSKEIRLWDCGFLVKADAKSFVYGDDCLFGKDRLIGEEKILKELIPERKAYSNKGNYGKILIIAGSKDITGAAYFSALASYRAGAGVVTVLTSEHIEEYLKSIVPEAIVASYSDENACEVALNHVTKASVIVLGPGIAVNDVSRKLVKTVVSNATCPIIVDADGLNVISEDDSLMFNKAQYIFTPHIGEMMRLSKKGKDEILDNLIKTASDYAKEKGIICVLKDAATVVASPNGDIYINTSGCSAMAKGGSGDVLTGIMAAVMSIFGCNSNSDMNLFMEAVSAAVYLHGVCGERAAERFNTHAVIARDLIDSLKEG